MTNYHGKQRDGTCDGSLAHLLLLHKLGVGAVVNNVFSENRSTKCVVDVFGTNITELAIENEIISLGS